MDSARLMADRFIPPGDCPVCGDAVPRWAKACPGCGADERSGWDEETARYDGLDLPETIDEREAEISPRRRIARDKFWLVIMGFVLVAVVLAFGFV